MCAQIKSQPRWNYERNDFAELDIGQKGSTAHYEIILFDCKVGNTHTTAIVLLGEHHTRCYKFGAKP